MRQRTGVLISMVIALVAMVGCQAIPQEHQGAAKGAGIGAATGAVAGAVIGNDAEGALIGGLAGALIGGAIGHYTVDQKRGPEETAQKYNYSPAEGTRVRIEDVSAEPQTVGPGDQVQLGSTYAVLSPSSDRPVEVTEAYEIRHNGELVGSPKVTVSHRAGTYSSSVPLFLPDQADRGVYSVTATIETDGAMDSRQFDFRVR